jgi:hypothetical protein
LLSARVNSQSKVSAGATIESSYYHPFGAIEMSARNRVAALTEFASADPADIVLFAMPKRICSQELK